MKIKKFYIKQFKKWQTFEFWRDMAIYFCVFSIIGHLVEIPYCIHNAHVWDIVPDDSGVWGYTLEPFIVYGIVAVFLIIFVYPFYEWMRVKIPNIAIGILVAFMACVFVSMLFELGMGLICNQPVDGKYPMWDNSTLPGNILGQAWIVNDVLLGAIAVFFVAFLYPHIQKIFDRNPKIVMNIAAIIVIVLFMINLHVTYGIFMNKKR